MPAPITGDLGVNKIVAFGFGAMYVFVGLVGFVVTGFEGFADPGGAEYLAGFAVNPLHNLVHLVIGLALMVASRRTGSARAVNGAVGLVYLLVGLLGLFIARPDNPINILAINGFDNVLHLGSAMTLLGVAAVADRPRRPSTGRPVM